MQTRVEAITEIKLPFAHVKVKIADLQPDGRLLTPQEVESAINFVASKRRSKEAKKHHGYRAIRIKKKEMNARYGIIAFGEEYFAIYRGMKQQCHLGSGGFGYAKLVQNIKTGSWEVLKIAEAYKKDDYEYPLLERVGMAIGRLERTASDTSAFVQKQRNEHPSYYTLQQSNIVMHLAEGTVLSELLVEDCTLSDVQMLQIIIQILRATAALHAQGIIHGDLKLNNIFYDFITGLARIIDYGNSQRKRLFGIGMVHTLAGTRGYLAPELDCNVEKYHYTKETDLFAIGMTIIYFLRDREEDRTCSRITDDALHREVRDFCHDIMCNHEAKKRGTLNDAIIFFENLLKKQFNLLPGPPRKVCLISLDELQQLTTENDIKVEPQPELPVAPELPLRESTTTEKFVNFFRSAWNGLFKIDVVIPPVLALIDPYAEARAKQLLAKERYDKYIEVLKNFDEIWLIDSKERCDRDYIAMMNQLAEHGIHVGRTGFRTYGTPAATILDAIVNQLESSHSKLNKYFYVTAVDEQLALDTTTAIMVLKIDNATDVGEVKTKCDEYALSDISAEFEHIYNELKNLAAHFYAQGTSSHSISQIVVEAAEEIKTLYALRLLSHDYLQKRLKMLKARVSELGVVSSDSKHKSHGLFSSKSKSNFAGYQEVNALEEQVQGWVAARHCEERFLRRGNLHV